MLARFVRSRPLAVILLFASAAPSPGADDGIRIVAADDAYDVATGAYRWRISRRSFNVLDKATVGGGEPRLAGGSAAVRFMGRDIAFGPPLESGTGGDWVELRGWASPDDHLWYVARYQFFAGRPFCRIVLTLTDRHDAELPDPDEERGTLERIGDSLTRLWAGGEQPRTEPWSKGPGDPLWKRRHFEGWRIAIGAAGGHSASVTQANSFHWSSPGEPRIEVESVSGSSYKWQPVPELDDARYQLAHHAGDPRNRVTWYPAHSGTARLEALYTGPRHRYQTARGVTYDIRAAGGQTTTVTADQETGPGAIDLGTHDLDDESYVALAATGAGREPQVVAGSLRVEPVDGEPFEVSLGRRHPGILEDRALVLGVKDFWQHHPISLFRTETEIGWRAVERPALLGPGMGLTLEAIVGIEGDSAAALQLLYAPPERQLPGWVHPIDGSLTAGETARRYDDLLRRFAESYPAFLEDQDSFGWRNWGDYQIGASYAGDHGPVEQWANLQYDLPHGLLLAWLRTGDPELWRHAQSSVRHLMDIDLVKFQPLPVKLNGLVYRKGETPLERSHVAAEPIVGQGFAFRSLLLYHALTGEEWARDLARQNVRQLAWYGRHRLQFVRQGDRGAAWMLRGALAGAEHFTGDQAYDYEAIAEDLVGEILDFHRTAGRLPGGQPVWQGQLVEALALFHARTGREDVAQVIVESVRHFLERCLRRGDQGELEFAYSLVSREPAEPFGVKRWTTDENYAFLWLGAIAYAHSVSGDALFRERGKELFVYAAERLSRDRNPRPWTSALAFPHFFLSELP